MWALFAAGAAFVCIVCWIIAVSSENDGVKLLAGFVAVVAGLGTVGSAVIALIRFVKWVWG